VSASTFLLVRPFAVAAVTAAATAWAVAGCSSESGGSGAQPGAGDEGGATGSADGGSESSLDARADAETPESAAGKDAGVGGDDGGGGGGGDGADGGPGPSPDAGGPPAAPLWLSQTGLFRSVAADGTLVLADGVQAYTPAYVLWADGATKTRWVLLPPGSKIDTTDMDHWKFPVGTKLFKEFALAGKRLETRMIWHYGPGADDFLYRSYWWNPQGTMPNDAQLADPANGEQAVNGTDHDIPPEGDCETCHTPLEDHVLGFGAIQLNHPAAAAMPGATIASLIQAGALTTNPTVADLAIPGNATEQAALGYLHANCSNCHNDTPGAMQITAPLMNLRVYVGTRSVTETNAYKTAVNQPTTNLLEYPYRIAGGDTAKSAVSNAMANRANDGNAPDPRAQMPPLATNEVDMAGMAAVNAWIKTLPKAP
jgi:hypothetical protein